MQKELKPPGSPQKNGNRFRYFGLLASACSQGAYYSGRAPPSLEGAISPGFQHAPSLLGFAAAASYSFSYANKLEKQGFAGASRHARKAGWLDVLNAALSAIPLALSIIFPKNGKYGWVPSVLIPPLDFWMPFSAIKSSMEIQTASDEEKRAIHARAVNSKTEFQIRQF
jgi:hypothetical protein